MNFKEWFNEMALAGLRIDPAISSAHPGEVKMLGGEKIKKCLEDKFRNINVPVKVVLSPKPTQEEKTPEPGFIKFLIKDRGGDPMTCWMILHRIGHLTYAGRAADKILSNSNWYDEYVKYHPEWLMSDGRKNHDAARYAFSKFLKFLSARKTASAVNMWDKNTHPRAQSLRRQYPNIKNQPANYQFYNAIEDKSYANHEEFEHELVAELLWNGHIRVEEDPNDPYVKNNPGTITKIVKAMEEAIRKDILSYVGQVVE